MRAPATPMSESMTRVDVEKRAELTAWSRQGPAHVAKGYEFPTLRKALAVAASGWN